MGDRVFRFWAKAGPPDENGCREWTGARHRNGYGKFGIWPSGTTLAHRMAYELTVGPIPAGMVVRHSCDKPACVEPTHLLLGTQADNLADRAARGRTSGTRLGIRKTDPAEARTAVEDIRAGRATKDDVADWFGVSEATVRDWLAGRHTVRGS